MPAGWQALEDELRVLRPRELVVAEGADLGGVAEASRAGLPLTRVEPWQFDRDGARRALLEQFKTRGLEGFGLDGHDAAIAAAGALVAYLRDSQKADLAHVRSISFRQQAAHLLIDPVTLKHLEILEGSEGGRIGSLLDELDQTITPMGGRLLRSWLVRPLVSLEAIRDRLDAVEEIAFRGVERAKLRDALKSVHDLERLVARAALGVAGPRDLVGLKQSLGAVPRVRVVLETLQAPLVTSLVAALDDVPALRTAIDRTLVDEPGALARDGGMIRDGVDPELDDLRHISRSGKQVIAEMEERERARTGIASLKVRFNRVFGYYIEISKANLHNVPADYHRKQTMAGGERFITPALKEYEEKVLGADERILEREIELFEALRAAVAAEAPRVQDTARALAVLDVLGALADTASVRNYTKPHVHDGDEMAVVDGRHPVVERHAEAAFVPNDITLNGTTHQLVVLTGPNMGGKSTYLRQTALLCLMAQIGSFVPAREAKLALVDRIFARVGASDNIARGQSTFMVEMQETASILHLATVAQPGRARRDWPRHRDLRRAEHRLGGRRAPGVESTRAPEDAVCHALPRAHGPGRRAAGCRELPRHGARVPRPDRVPAQDRARALGPQLRHPGGTPGRPAGRRGRARPRNPRRPRAGRTGARRAADGDRRRTRAGAAARPLRADVGGRRSAQRTAARARRRIA